MEQGDSQCLSQLRSALPQQRLRHASIAMPMTWAVPAPAGRRYAAYYGIAGLLVAYQVAGGLASQAESLDKRSVSVMLTVCLDGCLKMWDALSAK